MFNGFQIFLEVIKCQTVWRCISHLSSNDKVSNLIGFRACRWIVRNEESIFFWYDKWLYDDALCSRFPRHISIVVDKESRAVDLWNNGAWFILFRREL